ncbi:hypothetical protein V1503_19680 [Bacillus sp. SCS-151]|uniref:hypothetical protein n=1 Tax=Nanhaiella sioensis TaxID=3115293 RepID=UPI0039799FEE
MKRKVSILAILAIFLSANFVSAQEFYSHKGAAYNSWVTDQANQTQNITSSAVVMSASTVYAGNSSGKEMIRAWNRCGYVSGRLQVDACWPTELTVSLTSPDGVRNLITNMTPNESSTRDLGGLDWLIGGYFANGVWAIIKAIANDVLANVTHTTDVYDEKGTITFKGSNLVNTELPMGVNYDKGDEYADGKSSGVVGYFTFDYQLQTGQKGNLKATAKAEYDVRKDLGLTWSAVYTVKSGEAVINHTVTGK